jgi:hypothetical protein
MMRLLAVLGVGSVLLVAPSAMAQCTTRYAGASSFCSNAALTYTCAAASLCYATETECLADPDCSRSCNISGIASGCDSTTSYSCKAETQSCFGSYARCAGDPNCSRSPDPTCNTTGVSPGCPTNVPFSCAAEPSTSGCYATYNECINAPPCAARILTGSGTNAWGCLAAPGFTPALGAGLLLLLAGRRRTRRT